MAEEKIKIRLKRILYKRTGSKIPGTGTVGYNATIDGRQVGSATEMFKQAKGTRRFLKSRMSAVHTLDWSAEVDVKNKNSVVIQVECRDNDMAKPTTVGTVNITLNYPFKQILNEVKDADTGHFMLEYDVVLKVKGVWGRHAPKQIFATRQNASNVTATTVSGVKRAVHLECHPVVPTPRKGLPARPAGWKKDNENKSISATTISHDSAINVIPNPAVIPILTPPLPARTGRAVSNDTLDSAHYANQRNIAIIKCSWFCPSGMEFKKGDKRLEWTARGTPPVKFYDQDGFPGKYGTEIGVYATGNAEGEVVLEAKFNNVVLTRYRLLAKKIKKIPCRFNILKVTGNAADSPKCTAADLIKHMAITNRYLRQAGVELSLDASTDTTDGAVATSTKGIFTINVPVGNTKNVSDARAKIVSTMNYRENVINIVYIHSQSDGSLGFVTANPGRDDEWRVDDNGNPSTSWKKNSGVQYMPPNAGVAPCTATTMKLFAAEPFKDSANTALNAARLAVVRTKTAWDECKAKNATSATTTKAKQVYDDTKAAFDKLNDPGATDKDRNIAQAKLRAARQGAEELHQETTTLANNDKTWEKAKEAARKAAHDVPTAYQATKPGLGAVIISGSNGNPNTEAANYGNTIPHELGHIFCLQHRGSGSSNDDEVGYPRKNNLMHATNPATIAQDLDIIQTKAIFMSPLAQ